MAGDSGGVLERSENERAPFPDSRRRHEKPISLRRHHRLKGGHSIHLNIIPLVDVTFLLMIFFVIAGTFEQFEGVLSSRMVDANRAAAVPLPFSPIIVRVSAVGPEEADCRIDIESFFSSPPNPSALTEALLQIHQRPGFDKETPVILTADDKVRWDHVVGCWNAAVRAGCRHVAFSDR